MVIQGEDRMSEQYRCSECGHLVEIQDDAICDVCNIGKMQHLRYTKGGDGSHWEGCEEVHLDCRIAQLEAELARLNAERRWIPVSEKLPEIGFAGLCQVAGNGYVIARYAPYDSKEGWTSDEIGYCEVTHYSPLPPAPESEG